jgi:hypothetical protein
MPTDLLVAWVIVASITNTDDGGLPRHSPPIVGVRLGVEGRNPNKIGVFGSWYLASQAENAGSIPLTRSREAFVHGLMRVLASHSLNWWHEIVISDLRVILAK